MYYVSLGFRVGSTTFVKQEADPSTSNSLLSHG